MKRIKDFKIPSWLKIFSFWSMLALISLRLLGGFLDPDLWWHIRLGGDILVGKWVNTLTFTCTDYTWVNHSWLSDVLINQIHLISGFEGLSIFFALVFLGGTAFAFLSLRELLKQKNIVNSKINTLLFFVFFILVITSFIAARPQVFTFFFFNLLIYCLLKFYFSKKVKFKNLVLFVPLFVLWVNLHGGFVIGIALIAVFIIDIFFNFLLETFKTKSGNSKLLFNKSIFLFCLLIIFLLSSLINPFGFGLWKEIFTLVLGSNNASFITEWRAINIKDTIFLFYFLLFIGGFVLQIINGTKSSIRLILLLCFGLLSLYSVRYILPVSGLILVILFTEANILLNTLLSDLKKDKDLRRLLLVCKYFLIFFIFITGVLGASLGLNFLTSLNRLNTEIPGAESYPLNAVKFLKQHSEDYQFLNFYNTYVWGGYLEYNLPNYKWIIDGRMPEWQCIGKVKDNIMLDYMEVESLNSQWKNVLTKYNIQGIIIKSDGALSNILESDVEWKSIYSDSQATIFVRR